ncbi:SigE family RNA polymerase sigma factor [Yinghuangia seranimata]|uniref:SigE family RNA polymerase sigma factor n=1 Tax=Yinghuangia seranimata TaxID=408067 RepID=UPI00248ADC80|nr:SigE family RNA polymerase sigma factor [Yinghuangia seranimata]MDI2131556.1 SigE family RNA polymerase sigma factor [Yinghuangia seranimata]
MEFEEFAAARLPGLLRCAYMLCGDRELARDITQEVLTRALVKWRRISGLAHPEAYVRTMVTNEFLSLRRRKAVATVALTYEALDGPAAPTAEDPGHQVGLRADLWQRLGALPRKQRAVVVLRYYEGLTDNEIADALGCRPSTVRGYAARALATLRVSMTEESGPAPDRAARIPVATLTAQDGGAR